MTVEGNNVEYLDVVDANNNIIDKDTRANIHKKNLFHRAVHIIVLNSQGEIFIQRRNPTKDTYPDYWDVSSAGHLNVGENYDDAARRELKEELGIEKVHLEYLGEVKGSKETDFEFIKIFKCIYNGKIEINKDEISEGKFAAIEELKKLLNRKQMMKFTPALKNIVRNYL